MTRWVCAACFGGEAAPQESHVAPPPSGVIPCGPSRGRLGYSALSEPRTPLEVANCIVGDRAATIMQSRVQWCHVAFYGVSVADDRRIGLTYTALR